jgi:hypothetical protein
MALSNLNKTVQMRWYDMVKTIELSRIKSIAQFKSLLKKVQKDSDQYLLEQKGEVGAAIVPPAQFEAMVDHDVDAAINDVRTEDARHALFEVMDRIQAKNLEFSEEEVEQDIMAAREEIRHSHAQSSN